jgi:hypothetical protein
MRATAPSKPPNGRRWPTPRFCATGAGGVTMVETCASSAGKLRPAIRTRRRYIAARATVPYHCTNKGGNIDYVPLYIFFSPAKHPPRQGSRRYTPRCGASGASGVAVVITCFSAAANLRPRTRTHRRYIAERAILPLRR